MPSSDQIATERRRVLDQAREPARSGRHADHKSIIREMERVEGFAMARVRFREYAFLAQLDRMCHMARETPASKQEGEPQAQWSDFKRKRGRRYIRARPRAGGGMIQVHEPQPE